MIDFWKYSRRELGKIGENLARLIIWRKTGLNAVSSIAYNGDLLLSNNVLIEVKTIRQNKRRKCSFSATVFKLGSQSLGKSQFVFLHLIDRSNESYYYVIPSEFITSKRIHITSHPDQYAGRFKPFRNAFHLLQV